jgi:hypothetical protein
LGGQGHLNNQASVVVSALVEVARCLNGEVRMGVLKENRRIVVLVGCFLVVLAIWFPVSNSFVIGWVERMPIRIPATSLRIQIVKKAVDLENFERFDSEGKALLVERIEKAGFDGKFFIVAENGSLERIFKGTNHRIYAVVKPDRTGTNNVSLAMVHGRVDRTIMILNSERMITGWPAWKLMIKNLF